MNIVPLVSGGLDSTVMSVLIRAEGWTQWPLFINYGQINLHRERKACFENFAKLGLPQPSELNLSGYGEFFPSGLTNVSKHIVEDVFLPGRNLLFLLSGAAYAFQKGAEALSIGFLSERLSLFPDQRRSFVDKAEVILSDIIGRRIRIVTPLIGFEKAEVLAMAKELGVRGTYSCHAGGEVPCGMCVACREFDGLEVEIGRQ